MTAVPVISNKRSPERLEALSYILSDGLYYSWFALDKLNSERCTAVVRVDGPDDEEGAMTLNWRIGPDDVARGLRMYREVLEGKREEFKGAWGWLIKDLIRNGHLKNESEFVPEIHARADADSYGWQTVIFDRTNGAEGDYDANTADNVMQLAIFGEIRYG
jgi:hypothetical protein